MILWLLSRLLAILLISILLQLIFLCHSALFALQMISGVKPLSPSMLVFQCVLLLSSNFYFMLHVYVFFCFKGENDFFLKCKRNTYSIIKNKKKT